MENQPIKYQVKPEPDIPKPYGYIYVITQISTQKQYVGKHKSTKFDPTYWGCGKVMKQLYKTVGKEDFTREILDWAKDKEDLNAKEKSWISMLGTRENGYNIATGGDGGITWETKEMVSNKSSNKFFGTADEKDSSFGSWIHGLIQKEANAVYCYTTSAWYKVLNKFLRNKPRPTSEYQPNDKYCSNTIEDLRGLINHLDNAISKFELKEPITVHRQMKLSNFQSTLDSIRSSKTGMYVDHAYLSTTTVQGSYHAMGDEPKLNLEISVPPGKGVGAWISPIARFPKESEFLLPRGCVYKVETDLSTVDWNSKEITLKVKVVGVPQEPPDVDQILKKHKDAGRYSEESDGRDPLDLTAKIGKLIEFQMNNGVQFKDSVEKSLRGTIKYNLLDVLYKRP